MDIDNRLESGDISLVPDIAQIEFSDGKKHNFYSFATKYCSHHKPLDFPIYDSYINRILRYFRDVDGFYNFSDDDLKNYIEFKDILMQFRTFYDLERYTLKEIDKYLWQLGKQSFPKKY